MRRQYGLILILVLALSSLATACQREPLERIVLSDMEDEASSIPFYPDLQVVRIAVAPVLSPRTTLDTYQELDEYI